MTTRPNYWEKYDPTNEGTTYAFDKFYDILVRKGFNSNLVAVCGENIERYLRYAEKVAYGKAKAVFVENDSARYQRLIPRLSAWLEDNPSMKNHVSLVFGNVATYLDISGMPISWPARIEDIGIGMAFDRVIDEFMIRLIRRQSTTNNSVRRRKAQMFDGARRNKDDASLIDPLVYYLSKLDVKIETINGYKLGKCKKPFSHGKPVKEFFETKKQQNVKVYEHAIVLGRNLYKAELYAYTYINGSGMLCCMLVYE